MAEIAPIRVRSLATELFEDLGDTSQGLSFERACLIHYAQTFTPPGGGARRTRHGLLALVRLPAAGSRVILPHERIFERQSEDRAREYLETRRSGSPILLTYRDDAQVIRPRLQAGRPLAKFETEDGIVHALSAVEDREAAQAIVAELGKGTLIIADGHHRYQASRLAEAAIDGEVAEGARDNLSAHHYVPALLVDEADPGLFIAPTHRLLHAEAADDLEYIMSHLDAWFDVTTLGSTNGKGALARLASAPLDRCAFAIVPRDGDAVLCVGRADRDPRNAPALVSLSAELRGLDVSVLHGVVLADLSRTSSVDGRHPTALTYFADLASAEDALASEGAALFLLRPPTMAQVRAVAEAGLHMPQKSTAFYPKSRSGIAAHLLDPSLRVGTL